MSDYTGSGYHQFGDRRSLRSEIPALVMMPLLSSLGTILPSLRQAIQPMKFEPLKALPKSPFCVREM